MLHLAAYYQSLDPAGLLTSINAVQDQQLVTSGVDVRVPAGMANVLGAAALINDASAAAAQLDSPSLRKVINVNLEPVIAAGVFGSPLPYILHGDSPIPLSVDENLEFFMQSDPAAAADHYGFVFLGDGPIQPVKGPMYTLRCTAATAAAKGVWQNLPLVFGQVLPVGKYQVVGMRARGATCQAARLAFIGGTFRPGVLAGNAIGDKGSEQFRFGNAGVFGEFSSTTPPSVDVMDSAAETVVILLDLVQV